MVISGRPNTNDPWKFEYSLTADVPLNAHKPPTVMILSPSEVGFVAVYCVFWKLKSILNFRVVTAAFPSPIQHRCSQLRYVFLDKYVQYLTNDSLSRLHEENAPVPCSSLSPNVKSRNDMFAVNQSHINQSIQVVIMDRGKQIACGETSYIQPYTGLNGNGAATVQVVSALMLSSLLAVVNAQFWYLF